MTLALRVDGGPGIGAGHVMRCVALAEAWDGPAVFVGSISESLRPSGFPTASDIGSPEAIVADGYGFGLEEQQRLRRIAPLLVIDDAPRLPEYACDLLLDQNAGAEMQRYNAPGARLLLGSEYALVRRELRPARRERAHDTARVLVVLGGVGEGPREQVLDAVRSVPGAEVREPSGGDYAELLVWADVAVAAAGVTAWELAYAGVPALLLRLADNQDVVLAGATEAGCALAADSGRLPDQLAALLADRPLRLRMSAAGHALVDGGGAERVAQALRDVSLRLPAP